jgi:UDPglucose--hexose-1-phosphate uridylyltransferase
MSPDTPVRRRAARLADGRELIYFDDAGRDPSVADPRHLDAPDRRDLPGPPSPSELRYDPLLDEWVAVAIHRQTRTFLPPPDECPLCPSTEDRWTEIPAADYDVAVFENRFPSFAGADQAPSPGPTPFTPVRPGAGRCEVVCYTSDHHASFADLPPARVRTVIDALADRTTALSALPQVEQVFCFENRGVEIGVTLHHPHGQIYATPFVTPRTRAMQAAARRYAERTDGRNLYADVLAAEQKAGERVVAANAHWTAYVPAAARWPFEVHLAPHRHLAGVPELSDAERDAFAPIYLDVLRRFDGLFDRPMPYISAWHQAPVRGERELAYLHLQLFSIRRAADKLKYLAGAESGMGVFINDVRPERAAELLRNVVPPD